jgi:hypothetical protein
MLDYSELTVVKNTAGIPTALGYPVNSFLLQNNKPLFVGGGKGKDKDNGIDSLAVPAGLVCMTETTCYNVAGANANEVAGANANEVAVANANEIEGEDDLVPEGLYERLMELAEVKEQKKMTKKHKPHATKAKNKTHKTKVGDKRK